MSLGIFTTLGIVSYVFEGLIILCAIEISYGRFASLSALANPLFKEFPLMLAIIISYAIGQANSTLAHLIFQDKITATTLGRPSSYFLEGMDPDDADTKRGRRHRILRSFRKVMARQWRPFDKKTTKKFIKYANEEKIDLNDRAIFSRAMYNATKDEDFSDTRHHLLLNFNFSRNMFCAFILSFLIIEIPELYHFAVNFADISINDQKSSLRSLLTEWQFLLVFSSIIALLFIRYIYFFGVYTRHILLNLVEDRHEKS